MQLRLREKVFAIGFCISALILLVVFSSKVGGSEPAMTRTLVLAHYMPWYESPPQSPRYGWHWTMNHFDPSKSS
jgi:hypothetical protein